MIGTDLADFLAGDHFIEIPGFTAQGTIVVKLEGLNPTGSIKIKTALALIEAAERSKTIRRGFSHLIESSSGNLAVAMSAICANRGFGFTCVTDPSANHASLRTIEAYGGTTVVVTERDENGGYVGSRIREILRRKVADPDLVWLNQYENPANVEGHARWTAREILRTIPAPDWLFVGVGTGGTFMGCAQVFAQQSPATKLVAVDPIGSVIFGGQPGKRAIPGIGNSRVPAIFEPARAHDVARVAEAETVSMCRMLVKRYGLLLGGSSGSVLAAIHQMQHRFRSGDVVVAISPDLGDRYLETIYDDRWVAENVPDFFANQRPDGLVA